MPVILIVWTITWYVSIIIVNTLQTKSIIKSIVKNYIEYQVTLK